MDVDVVDHPACKRRGRCGTVVSDQTDLPVEGFEGELVGRLIVDQRVGHGIHVKFETLAIAIGLHPQTLVVVVDVVVVTSFLDITGNLDQPAFLLVRREV